MILYTERLLLREITEGDAGFMLGMFNDAAFQRFIGDKGVRTEEETRLYLVDHYISSFARHGFGPYCVVLKETGMPIGMCSVLKRDWLADPDFGYAFMPEYRHRGLAAEASRAVLEYAQDVLALPRLVAIIDEANRDSVKLINSLGFRFDSTVRESEDKNEVGLYVLDMAGSTT